MNMMPGSGGDASP